MIIAVDGTAASGKGTLARRLARELNLSHLDTGSLYRACGLTLLLDGATPATASERAAEKAARGLDFSLAADARARTREAGEMASVVAAMPPVRAALLEAQRRFIRDIPAGRAGAVLDGRDIGTVVLPDADHKFFVDAEIGTRAERRWKELHNADREAMLPAVEQELAARDARDKSRDLAPLRPADDAVFIDTTHKSVDEMVEVALEAIRRQPMPDGT